jgi:hypothetical protein
VQVPSSVTIPAGSTQATFPFRGIRPGTDEVVAEPSDSRFDRVWSRIQVSPAESLRMTVVAGDRQPAVTGIPLAGPVRFRVTDANRRRSGCVPVDSGCRGRQ